MGVTMEARRTCGKQVTYCLMMNKSSYPNSHKANVGIFWAFHENKSRVSGVFNDDFLCNLSRSYRRIITV